MNWQPIETAPKNGTVIDVWCLEDGGGYRIADVYWCATHKRWRNSGDERTQWAHQPSYWMPIPAAPSAGPAANDELHFNAQRLRNVARRVGLEKMIPEDDATLDGARGSVLGLIARKLSTLLAEPAKLPATSNDWTGDLIAAAEKQAEAYADDPRRDVKTDVLNAFYAGAGWQLNQQAPMRPGNLPLPILRVIEPGLSVPMGDYYSLRQMVNYGHTCAQAATFGTESKRLNWIVARDGGRLLCIRRSDWIYPHATEAEAGPRDETRYNAIGRRDGDIVLHLNEGDDAQDVAIMLAAAAEPFGERNPIDVDLLRGCAIDTDFQVDTQRREHIPTIEIEFPAVSYKAWDDTSDKGAASWRSRDEMAKRLRAAIAAATGKDLL